MKKLLFHLCCCVALSGVAAEPLRTVLFPVRSAVLSALVESRILKIAPAEGEEFTAGAELLTQDEAPFRLQVERARAALAEARASQTYAEKNLSRVRELFEKSGFQSRQEVEQAQLEAEVARSRTAAAESALKLSELELANCRLRAPFAGRLIQKLAQEHEYVRVGQNVLQVIDDHVLHAVVYFDSAERHRIHPGQKFQLRIDETGRTYVGRVVEIAGAIDSSSRTFAVKIELDNSGRELVAGMSGSLLAEVPEDE